LLDVVG